MRRPIMLRGAADNGGGMPARRQKLFRRRGVKKGRSTLFILLVLHN
jgi:hypothetical protein